MRLDAVARFLQDVAGDDTADAALPDTGGWILRRMELDIARLPKLGAWVDTRTRCTGVGRGWAERSTTLGLVDPHGDRPAITARAVWVYVDLASGAPHALPPEFFAVYGDGVRDHRVSARLALGRPSPDAARTEWHWRATDIDVYAHVNNASYWAPAEEWLATAGQGRRIVRAVVEFGAGMDRTERCELRTVAAGDSVTTWCCVGDEVRAAYHLGLEPIT